jgi:hypothetical protein
MVITKRDVLLPVKETGINNLLQQVTLSQLKDDSRLLTVAQYVVYLQEINKYIKPSSKHVLPLGATVDDNMMYTALYLNSGQLIPVKSTDVSSENNLAILDFKYYGDVNEFLLGDKKDFVNQQTEYTEYNKQLKEFIFKVKTIIAADISQNEGSKNYIQKIVTNPQLTRNSKIEKLVRTFKKVDASSLQNETYDDVLYNFVLKHIANEVLNDNNENLLLNNLVTSEVFNPNEITARDGESVLLNVDDVQKWVKKYRRED